MEVDHGYGKDYDVVVVCITLVIRYTMCMNHWGSSNAGILCVVVAVECYQSLFHSGSICGKGAGIVGL